jgi:hypothetical protein
MSDPDPLDETPEDPADENPPGPNLVLLYSLIALALAAAIAIAGLIVLPFYHRR